MKIGGIGGQLGSAGKLIGKVVKGAVIGRAIVEQGGTDTQNTGKGLGKAGWPKGAYGYFFLREGDSLFTKHKAPMPKANSTVVTDNRSPANGAPDLFNDSGFGLCQAPDQFERNVIAPIQDLRSIPESSDQDSAEAVEQDEQNELIPVESGDHSGNEHRYSGSNFKFDYDEGLHPDPQQLKMDYDSDSDSNLDESYCTALNTQASDQSLSSRGDSSFESVVLSEAELANEDNSSIDSDQFSVDIDDDQSEGSVDLEIAKEVIVDFDEDLDQLAALLSELGHVSGDDSSEWPQERAVVPDQQRLNEAAESGAEGVSGAQRLNEAREVVSDVRAMLEELIAIVKADLLGSEVNTGAVQDSTTQTEPLITEQAITQQAPESQSLVSSVQHLKSVMASLEQNAMQAVNQYSILSWVHRGGAFSDPSTLPAEKSAEGLPTLFSRQVGNKGELLPVFSDDKAKAMILTLLNNQEMGFKQVFTEILGSLPKSSQDKVILKLMNKGFPLALVQELAKQAPQSVKMIAPLHQHLVKCKLNDYREHAIDSLNTVQKQRFAVKSLLVSQQALHQGTRLLERRVSTPPVELHHH